jgi:SAM-dependent methyltransferase
VPDAHFEHPRLASIYDALDPGRADLEPYLAVAADVGARRVLDIGCGTGTFAVLLAGRGVEVTAVDPAAGSLDVARRKPGADRIRWIQGDATTLPPMQVDVVTMTGNVAQAIVPSDDWHATLRAAHQALRPGGLLVFETRNPQQRAWQEWTREKTLATTDIPGVGPVTTWTCVTDVEANLIAFESTFVFAADGAVLTSESTLRFRDQQEVEADLRAAGYIVDDVRPAPDRPGRELVFLARRPTSFRQGWPA